NADMTAVVDEEQCRGRRAYCERWYACSETIWIYRQLAPRCGGADADETACRRQICRACDVKHCRRCIRQYRCSLGRRCEEDALGPDAGACRCNARRSKV